MWIFSPPQLVWPLTFPSLKWHKRLLQVIANLGISSSLAHSDLKNTIVFRIILYNKRVKAACWNLKLSFYYLKQILCCYFCCSESVLTQVGTWCISFQNDDEIALLLGDLASRKNLLFAIVWAPTTWLFSICGLHNLLRNWDQTSTDWQPKLSLILSCNLGLFFNIVPDRAVLRD